MIRWKFLLAFSCLISIQLMAQNNWGLDVKLRSGFLSPHRAVMDHLPEERVMAGELSYFVELKDSNTWARFYPKPRIGVTAFFNQSGNTPILGHMLGMYAFGELPFFRLNRISLNARVGTGFAIITKVFDQQTNSTNNAVSSHFNGTVLLGMNLRYEWIKSSLALGAELTHFSNGSAKLPNLGLNYPFLSMSYSRILGKLPPKTKTPLVSKKGLPMQFGFNGIFSWKEVFPITGKKYPIYSLNLFARRIFSPKSGVEVAIDGIYKTSILDYLPEFKKKPMDVIQIGAFAGYVLSFDRLSTLIGMGGYFRDRYSPEGTFYHRIGFRYLFKSNLQVGCNLKSNWGKADYWEWSVGYVFKGKRK